jgi:hypothetical protein
VVNPIKQGQRREGMANDVVLSIVSGSDHRLHQITDLSATSRRDAPGHLTALRHQEDQEVDRR